MVGDDLIATSENRLVDAVERKACNAVSIKLDQIGTVTEALQVGFLQRGGVAVLRGNASLILTRTRAHSHSYTHIHTHTHIPLSLPLHISTSHSFTLPLNCSRVLALIFDARLVG